MKVVVVTAAESPSDMGLISTIGSSAAEVINEGLKLKHSGQAHQLVVSSIGHSFSPSVLNQLSGQGVSRCRTEVCDSTPSTMEIAELLEQVIREEEPELLLIGRPPGDVSGQLGRMLAELIEFHTSCSLPSENLCHRFLVIREVGNGMHTVELPVSENHSGHLTRPAFSNITQLAG